MTAERSEVLQGTLDLMILKTLHVLGPLHGFGIARRLEQLSEEVLKLKTKAPSIRPCCGFNNKDGSFPSGAPQEQPQGQVLLDHQAGVEAVGGGDGKLGAYLWGHRPCIGSGRPKMRMRVFAAKLGGLFGRQKADQDFDQEMRMHLHLLTEQGIRRGMSPEEARAAACRQFGNIALLQQSQREMRSIMPLANLGRDLRFAARQLRRSPSLATIAVVSLALGIGANTAIFTIAKKVLLDSLPVKTPQDLRLLTWVSGHQQPVPPVWGVLRTGFGIFSDILPGTVADLIGTNPPYDKTFQGGVLGTVGGTAIATGALNSAVGALVAANQTFTLGFPQGQSSLPPVAITAIPDGELHAPYFMEWSLGMEHQFGTTASLQAQYVGTRAVNQPYSTQVNGYQTVCQGCFAPFPYMQPTDARFGAVTQFSTGANSHYNGLQLTAMKRLSHGLQGQVNYTLSRCMDTVSNGGFLPFSAGGILSPLPGDLSRDYGPCDYDIRHNLNAQYVYQLPIRVRSRSLGYLLNGWQISGTAFWHSGVPFSVLSTPYSAINPITMQAEGIVQGSGPQFASVVRGVPLYNHNPIPGVTQAGTLQWLNPDAFVSAVDPSTGQCYGGDSAQNCQFGSLGRNALRGPDFLWSDFYLTKWFPLSERVKLRFEGQFFNVFNHPNFALPNMVQAGIPGNPSTQSGFGALTYTTSPPTGLLGVGLGGDSSPRMIAFQARLEF